MPTPKIASNLRNTLAKLYPDVASIRRIAADAGLNPARITFGSTAIDNWHAILEETDRMGKVDALLDVVLAEYGANAKIREVVAAYRGGEQDSVREMPPTQLRSEVNTGSGAYTSDTDAKTDRTSPTKAGKINSLLQSRYLVVLGLLSLIIIFVFFKQIATFPALFSNIPIFTTPNTYLQKIDFNYADSNGARLHGWHYFGDKPKPYDALLEHEQYGRVLTITSTVPITEEKGQLEFSDINSEASQGKFITIVMDTHHYRGTFYVVVEVNVDSIPYTVPINLVDPDGPLAENDCALPHESNSVLYIDGCTFKAISTPVVTSAPSNGEDWHQYDLNIEEILQEVFKKKVDYIRLKHFRITPDLKLAYIEIRNSK